MTALPGWYDDWLTDDPSLHGDPSEADTEPTPDPPDDERTEWDER